ncbi:MAG: AsmA family protein, partial [Bacteroidales bacterium]
MKKILGITLKSLGALLLLILILLFTIPVLFKGKIKTKVETVINESINAKVTFDDYKLGFFRNFPNLSFSLSKVSVVGIDRFAGDTLAGFSSFDLVFNLGSIFSKSGYEVKSIIIDKAVVNAIVLKDGKANWDIAKPSADTAAAVTTAPTETEASSSGSSMRLLLRKFEIKNSSISYIDSTLPMTARLENLNYTLSGDMTTSVTNLNMALNIAMATVNFDGVKYLNKVVIDSKIKLDANLDSMSFRFQENYFSINDLKLNFSGIVSMPGDDIFTDLKYSTEGTTFKSLLSLVPAVYMEGYEDLKASGSLALNGFARGVYSDADSTIPDIGLNLAVSDGLISYPVLPEKITNINVSANVKVDGKDMDKSTVNLDKFHFELAGSPFDLSFFMKTPVSDPDFKASATGKIDLAALSKAVPLDSLSLSGIIDMAMSMAGRLSMIEKEQYEKFTATGTLGIKNMNVEMAGYPGVAIKEVNVLFTPAYTRLQKADIVVAGTSDFSLTGNIENYIPYVFRNETIRGKLNLVSNLTDAGAIMNAMATDTTTDTVEDTTALAVIVVPKNIDFDFNAVINKFSYDNIKADNLKGHIIVRDGILMIRETGLDIMGGKVVMNADYDTRDTLKPVMKADFDMKGVGVKDAYNTFVTIQKFAPAAKGIEGKIDAQFKYSS